MSLQTEVILSSIESIDKICLSLLKTKHYEKLGREGLFAIVQKAKSLGFDPLEALNGGMYYVQGKVELSAITMARLIRQKKHSITMDKNSNNTICILHGKRADNGDTWKTSFSIEDAKRAGIYKEGSPWGKYPDIMCYNRALSKLARQLFPDVIGNCYVEGEISEVICENNEESLQTEEIAEIIDDINISNEQVLILENMLNSCEQDFKTTVNNFLKNRFGKESFSVLPSDMYQTIFDKINKNLEKSQEVA